jgi:hypothetical protein
MNQRCEITEALSSPSNALRVRERAISTGRPSSDNMERACPSGSSGGGLPLAVRE